MKVRTAKAEVCAELARLLGALWPESSEEEHANELRAIIGGTARLVMPMVIFVAEAADGRLVGFLEAGLRSCADGCDQTHAVGYVEGWYVAENHRKQGVGRKLLAAAEDWARGQGCVEMASDALIGNKLSHRVHEALGYTEVERAVHFRKRL